MTLRTALRSPGRRSARTCWCGCSAAVAPTVRATIARIDAGRTGYPVGDRQRGRRARSSAGWTGSRTPLGRRLEAEANARGWRFGKLRRDLAVMNQPFATMLATKVLFAIGALIFVPLVVVHRRDARLQRRPASHRPW